MLSRMLGVAALTAAAMGAAETWSYDRCSAVNPYNWPSTCALASQTQGSPINLCGASMLPTPVTLTGSGYNVAQTLNVWNTGHTVQANVPAATAPSLQTGNLSAIVGRSTSSSDTWVLAQVHPHWGRTDKSDEGSEHYQEGTRYPFEAHLVHYNSKYSSFSNATSTGNSDALLVVGVFFTIGTPGAHFITKFGDSVATANSTPAAMTSNVTISDIFDGSGAFYSYPGSLTTPNCNQFVTWVVMKTPKVITADALAKFKAAKKFEDGVAMEELIAKTGNFRPLQDLKSRTLYQSSSGSATCTAVVQPLWTCPNKNGAASVAPLMAVNLLLTVLAMAFWL